MSVDHIIQVGGLLAIAAIIFAETGLLVGFFLPGDTLLIAAGVLVSNGKFHYPLPVIIAVATIAAIAGYQVGYIIGERAGPRVFKRKGGVLFKEDYLTRTEVFFKKHGGKTILLARFIAVVRTIIPLVAGMGKMDTRKFWFYNITGAILWTTSITLAAFWVGSHVPNVDKYLIYLVLLAIILTGGTVLVELVRSGAKRHELKDALKEELGYFFKKTKPTK